jgi:hypothetical protein
MKTPCDTTLHSYFNRFSPSAITIILFYTIDWILNFPITRSGVEVEDFIRDELFDKSFSSFLRNSSSEILEAGCLSAGSSWGRKLELQDG